MSKHTIHAIKLENGVNIVNFSSPHPFKFTTGEVLPKCNEDWSNKMKLKTHKTVYINLTNKPVSKAYKDIRLEFKTTNIIIDELIRLHEEEILFYRTNSFMNPKRPDRKFCEKAIADIILVPYPLLCALHNEELIPHPISKARTIVTADRITKEIYPDEFCV